MNQQLITALRDCVSVMEQDLNGLAVIQPELNAAREALATLDTAPVWHGEGLPPVGTTCQFVSKMDDGADWHSELRSEVSVEIIGHFHIGHTEVAAFVFDTRNGRQVEQAVAECFRPLRTVEQIEAEKRVQEIEVLEKDFFIIGFSSYRATAEGLHKLGYRKIEGGDNQAEALQVAIRALRRLETAPGCGCSPVCHCDGPEWSRAEIEGRMGEAEEALRKIAQIQGGAA